MGSDRSIGSITYLIPSQKRLLSDSSLSYHRADKSELAETGPCDTTSLVDTGCEPIGPLAPAFKRAVPDLRILQSLRCGLLCQSWSAGPHVSSELGLRRLQSLGLTRIPSLLEISWNRSFLGALMLWGLWFLFKPPSNTIRSPEFRFADPVAVGFCAGQDSFQIKEKRQLNLGKCKGYCETV